MRYIAQFLIFCLVLITTTQAAQEVKAPNVAGQFYSADPAELRQNIATYMAQVNSVPVGQIQAMIAPHAGYVYSGAVAAYGYNAARNNKYSTIVVIAPSHFVPFDGVSLWPQGSFQTPLGMVDIDEDFTRALMKEDAQFRFVPEAFDKEHALEVQLPFIQTVFPGVKIVAMIMGNADAGVCQRLAKALDKIVGQRSDVLVIASSDMSHYHDYATAVREDDGTLDAIRRQDPEALFKGCLSGTMEMCGFVPATAVLLYARFRNLDHAEVLKYANSGDVTGDKTRVVGYSSTVFYKLPQASETLSKSQKERLVTVARNTLDEFVTKGSASEVKESDPRLNQVQGAFVTLTKQGQLRGCIGAIIGQKPLVQTVRDMSIAAASEDPRFKPVAPDELKDIEVEVSVLSLPQRIKDAAQVVLGTHGVIISDGGEHQGVFLPQVATETGWGKEEFLSELCAQKADLPPDCWKSPGTELYIFTADVFK